MTHTQEEQDRAWAQAVVLDLEAKGPDADELKMLRAYADHHGRRWRKHLEMDWQTGRDVAIGDRLLPGMGCYLRRLRNRLGPRWLAKFELEEEERT